MIKDEGLREKIAQKLCECNTGDWEDLDQLGQEGYLRAANEVLPITLKAVGRWLSSCETRGGEGEMTLDRAIKSLLRGEMPEEKR